MIAVRDFDEYITKPIIDEHILLDTIACFLP
jgi:hypothetical protein